MYKSCKTEKTVKRQNEIEDRFITLLIQKQFDEITVSEICRDLNIPRKAFYRYFESKEGILKAAIDRMLLSYDSYSKTAERGRRTVTSELEYYFEFWKLEPQRKMLNSLKKNNLYGHLIQCSVDYSTVQMAAISKFLSDEGEGKTQVFHFAITGLMLTMLQWYDEGFKKTSREMAIIAKRLLTAPLFQNLESWGILDE